jgi:hypothetical protein
MLTENGHCIAVVHPEWGAAGLQPPQTPQNQNLRNIDFVDRLLRNFPFSRNQPLKSADDYYITILKNKLIKLKKTRGWDTD